jgi:DNA-binding NarL/FixJ family response regulator
MVRLPRMRPISVVLVDDNDMLAEALRRVLAKDPRFAWGGWAANREEVVRLLAGARIDLVLMDVDLPGTDTFALVRELASRQTPIRSVMFSGHVRREYVDAAVDAGAFGYLSKDDDLGSICANLVLAHGGQVVLSRIVRQILGAP